MSVELQEFQSASEMRDYYEGCHARTGKYGVPTIEIKLQADIEKLHKRIAELEGKVAALGTAPMPLSQQPKQPVCESRWELTAKEVQRKFHRVDVITDIVLEFYGYPKVELLSHRREAPFAITRQVLMWLVRTAAPDLSYPQIGAKIGHRDHSTVLHGVRKIGAILAGNDSKHDLLRSEIAVLHARVKAALR